MALGTSIPWLSKMNEVRLVSSELTIHKTSKADKEGGLLRIAQSGMGGFKVN